MHVTGICLKTTDRYYNLRKGSSSCDAHRDHIECATSFLTTFYASRKQQAVRSGDY